MESKLFILSSFSVLFGTAYPANAQSLNPARPNILLVIAEDMTNVDLGCYGNQDVKTPNLDSFASEAVRYTNAFSTGAVSSATRSGLITGMYQTSIGAHNHRTLSKFKKELPKDVHPITTYIRNNGYFPILCAHDNKKWGKSHPGPWGSGKTDFNFKFAEKELFDGNDWNDTPEGKPFFAYLTLQSSHRGKWWNATDAKPGGVDPNTLSIPPFYPDNEISRKDFATYYDAVQKLDTHFGEIINRLKNEKLLNNTIIVFMSDHGRPMPRDKQFCFDSGIHIPLMVRYPDKQDAGTINDKLVSSIDISAQIIDWTGGELPSHIHGVPFANDESQNRNYVISARDRCDETVHRIRSVRTKKYHYIKNFDWEVPYTAQNRYKDTRYPILINMRELYKQGKLNENQIQFMAECKPKEQLFDVEDDPYELRNLADDPSVKKELKKMRRYLTEWLNQYPDMGEKPEPQCVMDDILKQRKQEYGF